MSDEHTVVGSESFDEAEEEDSGAHSVLPVDDLEPDFEAVRCTARLLCARYCAR
jgi:hypothetical protein